MINLSTKIENSSGIWYFYINTDSNELVGFNGSITDGGQNIKSLIPDWNGFFDQNLIDELEEWLSR